MENETSVFFLTQSISKERCFRFFSILQFFLLTITLGNMCIHLIRKNTYNIYCYIHV